MTTKPSSTPLEQEVAEYIASQRGEKPGSSDRLLASLVLQLITSKLPKEKELPKVEDTTYGFKFGYNTAIKEVHRLLGDGTK